MPFGFGILSSKAERPTRLGLAPNDSIGAEPGGGGGIPKLPGGGGGGGGIPKLPGGGGGGGGGGGTPKPSEAWRGRGRGRGGGGGGGGGGGTPVLVFIGGGGGGSILLINVEAAWITSDFCTGFTGIGEGICGNASVWIDFSMDFFSGVLSVAWETYCKRPWRIFCLMK